MYRIVIILGFLVAVSGIVISFQKLKGSGRTPWRLPQSGFLGLVSLLLLIAFGTLAVTGFLPVIFTGGPVSGLGLILHATAGPVFAVCLAIVGVMLAGRFRLASDGQDQKVSWGFWLIILFAIPLIFSAVVSMLPIFGTEGQHALLHLHGYSAVLLLLTIGITYYLSRASGDGSK
jgi:hypothetical protein